MGVRDRWRRRRDPLVGREDWERELDGWAGPGTDDWALSDPPGAAYEGGMVRFTKELNALLDRDAEEA